MFRFFRTLFFRTEEAEVFTEVTVFGRDDGTASSNTFFSHVGFFARCFFRTEETGFFTEVTVFGRDDVTASSNTFFSHVVFFARCFFRTEETEVFTEVTVFTALSPHRPPKCVFCRQNIPLRHAKRKRWGLKLCPYKFRPNRYTSQAGHSCCFRISLRPSD